MWPAIEVTITHPDKVVFPGHGDAAGYTKLDLVRYYLSVADGALRGVAGRPMILKRFVKGIAHEAVFQKRAPAKRPDWVDVAELRYARGTSAKEAVIHDAAGLAWADQPGMRRPQPASGAGRRSRSPRRTAGRSGPDARRRLAAASSTSRWWPARCSRTTGWSRGRRRPAREASTSTRGSPRAGRSARCGWPPRPLPVKSSDGCPTRRPAVGGRKSARACSSTSTRTPRTAPSRRPTRCGPLPDARVSTPLHWDEVAGCRPEAFTIATVPGRFAELG